MLWRNSSLTLNKSSKKFYKNFVLLEIKSDLSINGKRIEALFKPLLAITTMTSFAITAPTASSISWAWSLTHPFSVHIAASWTTFGILHYYPKTTRNPISMYKFNFQTITLISMATQWYIEYQYHYQIRVYVKYIVSELLLSIQSVRSLSI